MDVKMFLTKFCFLLLLNLCLARYTHITPKFYGQDSAIIVDTDKPLSLNLNPKLQNALYYNYPVYHLIKQQSKVSTTTSTTTPSTTTTSTTTTSAELPFISTVDNEFPSDLLHIAQHKLGLKRLEDLPSISELGELLGTENATETIKYMRQLTATEQGIALMRAYIESSDDVDNSNSGNDDNNEEADADDNDGENNTNVLSENVDNSIKDEELFGNAEDLDEVTDGEDSISSPETTLIISTTTPKVPEILNTKPSNSFLQRFSNYISFYQLWPSQTSTTTTTTTPAPPSPIEIKMPTFRPFFISSSPHHSFKLNQPFLVRSPLPFHYPIPLRPIRVQKNIPEASKDVHEIIPAEEIQSHTAVHLNTPRHIAAPEIDETGDIVAPHVQQLAQMANVSPKKLEQFLKLKPKLAELAVRASLLPMKHTRRNNDGSAAVEQQLFAAVQRAIEQDDDLKKLLSSVETLK